MRGFRLEDGVAWIDDRAYPWASNVRCRDFEDIHQRGFHLTFENGWLISILWGTGTYSDNHNFWQGEGFREETGTAEIVVWQTLDDDRGMREWPGQDDTVMGWCTPVEVNQLIVEMMGWPSVFELDDSAVVAQMCRQRV